MLGITRARHDSCPTQFALWNNQPTKPTQVPTPRIQFFKASTTIPITLFLWADKCQFPLTFSTFHKDTFHLKLHTEYSE